MIVAIRLVLTGHHTKTSTLCKGTALYWRLCSTSHQILLGFLRILSYDYLQVFEGCGRSKDSVDAASDCKILSGGPAVAVVKSTLASVGSLEYLHAKSGSVMSTSSSFEAAIQGDHRSLSSSNRLYRLHQCISNSTSLNDLNS